MKTYVVTSDQLSRKRGSEFTDTEIGEVQAAKLVQGGHLSEKVDDSADE